MWKHWVNAVLGLLMVVLPWLGLDAVTSQWTIVVGGLVIAALSVWSATESRGAAGM